MKIDMNMYKCNIEQMNFKEEPVEDIITGDVFIGSLFFVCNAGMDEQGETGIILEDLNPSTNTIWNLMDLGNGLIMIRDISTNLYWTTRAGGSRIELAPLSNNPDVFQMFKQTKFIVEMNEMFYLDASGDRMVGYPRTPPEEGDILVLTEREENRGIFRTIRGA